MKIGDNAVEKCPVCGEPYTISSTRNDDQSACPSCEERARKNGMTPNGKWSL